MGKTEAVHVNQEPSDERESTGLEKKDQGLSSSPDSWVLSIACFMAQAAITVMMK